MANIGLGEAIYDLRKKVQLGQIDLDQLDEQVSELPELINSANLLRSNEHLSKINDKKTVLLAVYRQYSQALEDLLASVFEIQKELKDILKEQSSIISDQLVPESDLRPAGPKSQPASKPKPKPRTKASPKPKPRTKASPKPKPRTKASPKPKPRTKASPKPRPKSKIRKK